MSVIKFFSIALLSFLPTLKLIASENVGPTSTPILMEKYDLPALSIEGLSSDVNREEGPTLVRPIEVNVGAGATAVYAPENELGVSLGNAVGLEDNSIWRRNSGDWSLFAADTRESNSWRTNFLWQTFDQRTLAGRIFRRDSNSQIELLAMDRSSRRKILYMNNHHTLYHSEDDTLESYTPELADQLLSLRVRRQRALFLLDRDTTRKDVFLSRELKGKTSAGRWETGLFGPLGNRWEGTFFGLFHQNHFESFSASQSSTDSEDGKLGLSALYKWPVSIGNTTFVPLKGTYFQERAKVSGASFHRNSAEVKTQVLAPLLSWMEVESFLALEAYQDSVHLGPSQEKGRQILNYGATLSTGHHRPLGVDFRFLHFERAPLVQQLFGDGALLQASSDLPPEIGWRYSLGPWLEWEGWKISAMAFLEHSRSMPLQLGVSPTSVRTFPLGAAETKGAQGSLSLVHDRWDFAMNYTYQLPGNQSAINWQRGKQIPGRSNHSFQSSLKYLASSRASFGADFTYASSSFLNLSNTVQGPQKKALGAFLQYSRSPWALRLEGKNLFPQKLSPRDGDSSFINGRVAPNLMELDLNEQEIVLTMEILI